MIPRKNLLSFTFLFLLDCLEEALKYVLLLNFDEEPKYEYLIDELKRAFLFVMNE
jgi:hypothetical protein